MLAGLKSSYKNVLHRAQDSLPSVKRVHTLQFCYGEEYSNPNKVPLPHWDKKHKREELHSSRRMGINMAVAFVVEPSVLGKSTGYAQQQEDFC